MKNKFKFDSRTTRFVIYLLIFIFAGYLLWYFLRFVAGIANSNEGVISAIGLFLVIPFSIWSARLLDRERRNDQRLMLLDLLTQEIWINLNYVSQLEESYKNNFELFEKENPTGVHIPYFGPRTSILEKFITVDQLHALEPSWRRNILEIYANLIAIKDEFSIWTGHLMSSAVINDRKLYEILSANIVNMVAVAMKNMMWLWSHIISTIDLRGAMPPIQMVAAEMKKVIEEGYTLHPMYKCSDAKTLPDFDSKKDAVLCWTNDWAEAPFKVVEVGQMGAIHESWRRAAPAPQA